MGNNRFIKLLPDMAVFVRVVETGSFSAAALELGLTPSAVSRQVTRLEQSLSVRLLERTTRKLRLSEPGKEAYRDCQKMVAAAKSAMDVAQQFISLPQGLIRVSMPKAFGKTVISPLMPAFLQQYPEVDVQLILTDRQPDLNNDDVDLAIYMTDNPPDGVVARPLMQVTQVLCATPRYLAEHGTPDHPGALSGHNCIFLGETANDAEWHFRRGGETTTIKVHGRYIANHSGVRLDGILQHLGIGCLPHFTATAALEEGLIVRVLTDWEFLAAYQGTAFLQYLPNRYMALKMRVFIDYLMLHLHSPPDHSADSRAQS